MMFYLPEVSIIFFNILKEYRIFDPSCFSFNIITKTISFSKNEHNDKSTKHNEDEQLEYEAIVTTWEGHGRHF